jgi:pimeloyl-ACP methyl ester carboxylesterase
MRPLERHLSLLGYQVANTPYSSTKHDLSTLSDMVAETIKDITTNPKGSIHFVGHSMGGLVIRAYLQKYRPEKLGRLVMLGTPNHGSEVADLLQQLPIYKRIYGPAGMELMTSSLTTMKALTKQDGIELGIVAGTRTLDPLSSYVIGKPSDGRVSVDSTRLEWMSDHLVLPVTHTFMPRNRRVMTEVANFLANGRFGD